MSDDVRIVEGRPPNYAELVEAFNPDARTVFAWDGTIYVPEGCADRLPPDLVAHERVHFDQQQAVGGPETWWRLYIDDPTFRLEQEVEAYRAQWRALKARPKRERFTRLYVMVCDLGGPMYGDLVTQAQARQLILAAAA
jgi:hypothetical protein